MAACCCKEEDEIALIFQDEAVALCVQAIISLLRISDMSEHFGFRGFCGAAAYRYLGFDSQPAD